MISVESRPDIPRFGKGWELATVAGTGEVEEIQGPTRLRGLAGLRKHMPRAVMAKVPACRAPGGILHVIGRHLERRQPSAGISRHHRRFAGRRSLFRFPETRPHSVGQPTDQRAAQCHAW